MSFSIVPLEAVGRLGWNRMLLYSLKGHKTIVEVFRNCRQFVVLSKVWPTCEAYFRLTRCLFKCRTPNPILPLLTQVS